MAAKQPKTKVRAKPEVTETKVVAESGTAVVDVEDVGLDPQEEKILDWILKGVVAFILGWLGLSILMVVGGFFGVWK